MSTDQKDLTSLDIRLHALNISAATYSNAFRIARDDEKSKSLADQVLADARKYAEWVEHGDTAGRP